MSEIRPKLVLVVALFSICAFAATGCGGGDGGSESEGLTTEEYITQADELCTQSDEENAKAAQAAFGNQQPTKEEAVTYVSGTLVPALEAQLQKLRDLPQPEGDTDTVNAIYDQVGEAIDTIKEDPEASLAVEDPFADITADAEAYGFKSCGVN
jgi:hypothetical protein